MFLYAEWSIPREEQLECRSDAHAGSALSSAIRIPQGISRVDTSKLESARTMSPKNRANEATTEESTPVVQERVKRKWVSYIWDTFDKSPEERRLLFKLDSAILTFASLGKLVASLALRTVLTKPFRDRVLHQVS